MPQTIAGQQSYGAPAPGFGPYISGYLPTQPLLTEYRTAISQYVQGTEEMPGTSDLIGLYCEPTILDSVAMDQGKMAFTKAGKDGGRPDPQHIPTKVLNLTSPEKYWLASAVTQDSWWNGMTEAQLRQATMGPLVADRELVIRLILGTMLTPSAWYNADQTPPQYAFNSFDATHDHYITYANAGVLTPEVSSYAKWHITHHVGQGVGDVICQVNSATTVAVEQEYGGFDATAVYQNLPVIQRMVEFGFRPGQPLAGVPTVINDFIPQGYALYTLMSPIAKPAMWRTTVNPETAGLIILENSTIPNVEFKWFGDYVRFGAPTVYRPEMGVAVKLDVAQAGDAYTAPTGILDIAV